MTHGAPAGLQHVKKVSAARSFPPDSPVEGMLLTEVRVRGLERRCAGFCDGRRHAHAHANTEIFFSYPIVTGE